MDEQRVQDTVDALRKRSTDELLRLYTKSGNANEGFEALRRLLTERNIPTPPNTTEEPRFATDLLEAVNPKRGMMRIAVTVAILSMLWLCIIYIFSGVTPQRMRNHFLWYVGLDSSPKVYPVVLGKYDEVMQHPRLVECENWGCSQRVTEILRNNGYPWALGFTNDSHLNSRIVEAGRQICDLVLDKIIEHTDLGQLESEVQGIRKYMEHSRSPHCAYLDNRGKPYFGIALGLFVVSAIVYLTTVTTRFTFRKA